MASNPAVQAMFNYAALSPDVRAAVEKATDRLHVLERKTGEQIIEIGRTLIDVKSRLDRGLFDSWVSSEFGWSRTTAYRFIHVVDVLGDRPNLGQMGPSALYEIVSGDVPEQVREQILERAESGSKVTHKDVKAALEEFKSRAVTSAPSPMPTIDDEEPEPIEYVEVDLATGEIRPPQSQNESTYFPPPTPAPKRSQPHDQANGIARSLIARHGDALARLIADAIYEITG